MEIILKPIEVIANFRKDGKILPVRIRLLDDESIYKVFSVKNILRVRQEKIGFDIINIYTCTGIINGIEKLFEIKFEQNRGSWQLYRM